MELDNTNQGDEFDLFLSRCKRPSINYKLSLIFSFVMIISGTLLLTFSMKNEKTKYLRMHVTMGGFFCLLMGVAVFITSWRHLSRQSLNENDSRNTTSTDQDPSSFNFTDNISVSLPPTYNEAVKSLKSDSNSDQETIPSYNTAIQILSEKSTNQSLHL